MAIPGENFVVRMFEKQKYLVYTKVLDLVVAGVADTVLLVSWGYSSTVAPNITLAGFSILRFDPAGNLKWEFSRTLCSGKNIECGQFEFEGALARTPNGFIVAGSGIKLGDNSRRPIMFAMRIDDGGMPLWARSYVTVPLTVEFGHISSIAPMSIPDHYLIGANSGPDAWLWMIDGGGAVVSAGIANNLFIRRLRATPSQGICALGEINAAGAGGTTLPSILNMDSSSFGPRWWRWYSTTVEAFLFAPRWFDIAEGDHSLLVIGNRISNVTELSPLIAFLDTGSAPIGDVRSASIPALGDHPVRMRGVSSFIEEVIPLASIERRARFAVTGEVNHQPWQFVMDEDGSVEWQKRYRTAGTDTGMLGPTAWPQYENILAAGWWMRGGTGSRPFLTSSRLTIPTKPGDLSHCATEIGVTFPDQYLFSRPIPPHLDPIAIEPHEFFHEEGPKLDAMKGCLDVLG